MTHVLIRDERGKREKQWRGWCEDGDRDWSDDSTSQGKMSNWWRVLVERIHSVQSFSEEVMFEPIRLI